MPPAYVKPYVKRQKNDAADAEAICEAVQRPNMRFVPIKSPEQQAGLALHRTRHLLIRQLTAVTNSIRAHLAELGIVAPVGRRGADALIALVETGENERIPGLMRSCLMTLSVQAHALREQIRILDRRLVEWHRSNELNKRLDAIPGVGPALATALVASVADPKALTGTRSAEGIMASGLA